MSLFIDGHEVTEDTFALRHNADTSHETARDWYEAYSAHVTTRKCGDLCTTTVPFHWLNFSIKDIRTLLADKWPNLAEDEALCLVNKARSIRRDAEELEELLDHAVHAYLQDDLSATIDALETASWFEDCHGDDPATRALARKLLERIPPE